MDIYWKNGAVCFALGVPWYSRGEGQLLFDEFDTKAARAETLIEKPDFQLNTIKQGDYIEASELDSHKYNDVVEVFELFGFKPYERDSKEALRLANEIFFVSDDLLFIGSSSCSELKKRKLTFQQLMAIGELKRLEVERDNVSPTRVYKDWHESQKEAKDIECDNPAPKITPELIPDLEKDGSKYHREIIGLDGVKTTVDVYRVLDAFKTGCAATDHAVKKMLCAGLRGHKDKLTDYDNAIESLQASKELLIQKSNNENTN